MLFISNRGNLTGPNLSQENNPEYVRAAMDKGIHVVVDVWIVKNGEQIQLTLGEIHPQYSIPLEFLQHRQIIARAKTIQTFQLLLDNNIHSFCDLNGSDGTLTSHGYIWTKPGTRNFTNRSVMTMPEWITDNVDIGMVKTIGGVCSNFIEQIKNAHDQLEAQKKAMKEAEPAESTPPPAGRRPSIPLDIIPEEPDVPLEVSPLTSDDEKKSKDL